MGQERHGLSSGKVRVWVNRARTGLRIPGCRPGDFRAGQEPRPVAKPILYAMQGIAYMNDRQIKGLHVEWGNIDAFYIARLLPVAG
jgi:hypothetical protein